MAIIKCPECGHQISDKAPTCPYCGVEIAGKIVKCPDCGEIYFSDEELCPHCLRPTRPHTHPVTTDETLSTTTPPEAAPPAMTSSSSVTTVKESRMPQTVPPPTLHTESKQVPPTPPVKKKAGKVAIIVSFVIALLVFGVCYYMYNQAQENRENEEYDIAMRSNEPLILQGYLDSFKDAPQEHRDSIEAHLKAIKQAALDWSNALASNSKAALMDYLNNHPGTPHRQLAMHKIDSIDWAQSNNINTPEAYQTYMTDHPDGDHYDEAEELMKKLKAQDITPEEKTLVANVFHNFFVAINEKDEEALKNTVADEMTLLNKENATKGDVVDMMDKLYKEGIVRMVWRLPGNYDIKKREVADDRYELNVSFSANQDVEFIESAKNGTNKFKVNATINPDGKISLFKMIKIVE